MKLDLSKLVNKSNDTFKRDAEKRQQWLDDSDVVVEVDELLINSNPTDEPDELRAMLNQNISPDFSDEKVGDVLPMASFETLCEQTFTWVPRNFDCVCGNKH